MSRMGTESLEIVEEREFRDVALVGQHEARRSSVTSVKSQAKTTVRDKPMCGAVK